MLLALDLGQTIGFVKGNAVGPLQHGVVRLPTTTDLGLWLAASDDGLRAAMRGATAIAVEQPFMGSSYYPARKLLAMLGHVYLMAHHYGITADRITEVPVASGKLALSGMGNATKEAMVQAAERNYGLTGLSEHEADALGIFAFWQFGPGERIAKPKTRSSKAVVVKP